MCLCILVDVDKSSIAYSAGGVSDDLSVSPRRRSTTPVTKGRASVVRVIVGLGVVDILGDMPCSGVWDVCALSCRDARCVIPNRSDSSLSA